MTYSVLSIPLFDRQAKRLAKKYPFLKTELVSLLESLVHNSEQGKALGKGFHKVRLCIAFKGKGKSGGARGWITYVKVIASNGNILCLSMTNQKTQLLQIVGWKKFLS